MTVYALVRDGTVEQVGAPELWWDGARWWDFRPGDPATYAAAGWLPVTETPRPPDTGTTTHDYTVELVDEQPAEVWSPRPWTPDELEANEARTNSQQMVSEQDESVDKLVAVVEALNLITALTNAEINANPAAIIKDVAREAKTIARVANREARLTSGRTESTDTGTDVEGT